MRVFIVEDEIRIREGIEKLLGKMDDLEIVGDAEDGLSGLEGIRALSPDLVITDIMMPGMDGLEMLTKMAEEGIKIRAIVLSAYSEFEYARRAMKLGVTEYLLKPIGYTDFSNAIENMRVQILKDRSVKPDEIGTIEQIFSSILNDRQDLNEDVESYLFNRYGINSDEEFAIMYVYLGSSYSNNHDAVKSHFTHMLSLLHKVSYCAVDDEYRQSIVYVIYHFESAADVERYVQSQIMRSMKDEVSVAWTVTRGIGTLREMTEKIIPYMDWGISLGHDVLISYPKVTNIQTVSCIYPIEKENAVKKSICDSDYEKMRKVSEDFKNTFDDGNVYIPKEIKECFVRFLWAIIGIAKETAHLDEKDIEQQKLLSLVMNAKTKEELSKACDLLLDIIDKDADEDDNITHLTVKRMCSIIHEFYSTGITLDEIAEQLNMTPEYVGTLFRKEMGVTYSTYIKNYRMNKAKELLCGTNMKLYEVAEQVGYVDPKYFSRVFKETTGMLPNEYRKSH